MEGDIILSVVDEINFSHRKVKVVVFLFFFLTLKNFFHQHWLEEFMMGCVQSKKEGVILKNNLPKNKKILKVAGEIVLKKDSDFNILWWLL